MITPEYLRKEFDGLATDADKKAYKIIQRLDAFNVCDMNLGEVLALYNDADEACTVLMREQTSALKGYIKLT
jgi:hypothetical protein